MGRIRSVLDALFDRAAKNAPQPGSVQTSAQLAQVLGLNWTAGMNAENPAVQIAEGFNKNVVVYRCVQEVARSAATVNLILYRKKQNGDLEEVKSHPLIDLLERPNPHMGRAEFLETWIAYLVLSGNTYCHAISVNGGRKLQELWPLRPDRCAPYVTRGMLAGYTVQTESGSRIFPVDPVTGLCEILHTKQWNPSDPFTGQSPLRAAGLSVDIHNATSEWNYSLLKNSAQPSGALTMAAAQGGVPNKLTDEEFERLKAEMDDSYSGTGNVGRPLLLEGGLVWTPMGLSPKDMDFLNTRSTTAREAALAFGVPPMLLGIPGDNTYSNQKEARLWFWEDTVLPILSLALSSLNRYVSLTAPGQGLFFGYDEDTIPALGLRREEMWDRVTKSEVLRVNEKREALGYEAITEPGGETILVSSSSRPLEQAVEPPPDPVALAEAVTRAKQPAAPASQPAGNDNNPAPAAIANETRAIVAEVKHLLGARMEVKFSTPEWRDIELDARSRLLTAAENNLRSKVKSHLRSTASAVSAALKKGEYANIDNVVASKSDELEDILLAAGYAVGELVSDRFLAAFKGFRAPERKGLLDAFWSLMAPFVESHTAKQVVNISETTRKEVQEAVADGLKLGESIDQIADRIQAEMRSSSASRATTIAITETHSAAGFAADASAKSVGVEMEKEWAAAGGERTRPTHARADGQRRRMDEPFTVGSSSLMFTGDPEGSAKEVINCRCTTLYYPKNLT